MTRQLGQGLMVRLLLLLLFVFSSATATAKERITYFHNDLLGSPVAATNAQGDVLWQEEYTAYGKRLLKADQGRNSRWFTGKSEAAALGVQYFDARWYDADLGRFLSVDPVDFQEGDVHSFNRYAYANNSPYRYVDPDGRMSMDINKPRTYGTEGAISFNTGGGLSNIGPSGGIKRGLSPNGDFVQNSGVRGGDYSRPSGFRRGVRDAAWDNAKEASTGRVRDPASGRFMSKDKPWDMGHKPGHEFRKHQRSAQERGIDRKQFLDEHNNPSSYRPELPGSNRSHRGEDKTDSYFGH